MATAQGLFNFDQIMREAYGEKVDKDDDEGRALKRGFQYDMIKKAADSQLAMGQAAQSQQFGMDAMQMDADLTQRNQRQLNQDAFNYGMQEMSAKYDYESRMAVDDAGRALNQMASAGDIQQNQTRLEGSQNRLTLESSARQDRLAIGTQGTQDRLTIGASGDQAVRQIGATGKEDRASIAATGDQSIRQIGATGVEDRAAIKVQGTENIKQIDAAASADIQRNIGTVRSDVNRAAGVQQKTVGGTEMQRERQAGDMALEQITGQGDQAVRQIGASGDEAVRQIGAQGSQDRETMGEQTRQTAKDRANQRQFSQELAAR